MTARLCVLASGSGSNLQAILDACESGALDATVVSVVSDRADAYALVRARQHGVAHVVHHPRPAGVDRRAWDASVADVVFAHQPDWIVLAGFMRLLSSAFLDHFPGRVINLHPARPGEFTGLHAIERAFEEFQQSKRSSTGVMVHLVPDEGVDDGPVLAVADVAIYPHDTLDSLRDRMHACEHQLLVSTLQQLTQEVSP